MKVVILLLNCIVFLDLTSTVVRGTGPSSRSSISSPGRSPASPESVNSPCEPTLYAHFPSNTKIYIQTPDGEVYFGPLTYMHGRPIPSWIFNPNEGADIVESVYVHMPNGDGLLSNIQTLEHNIDINDKMYEEHLCFVSYGNGHILVAVLEPFDQPRRWIPCGPRVIVRMPHKGTRYVGVLYDYSGRRSSWLQ